MCSAACIPNIQATEPSEESRNGCAVRASRSIELEFIRACVGSVWMRAANMQSPRTSKHKQTRRRICGCFVCLAALRLKQAILAFAQPRLRPRSPMARQMQAQRLLSFRRAAKELATGPVRERETNEEIRDMWSNAEFVQANLRK